MRLKTRLLALYFSFAIIPVVVVYFFSLEVYTRNASAIEEVLLSYAVSQTSRNISEHTRRYKYIMAQVATDRALLSLISDFSGRPSADRDGRAILFNQISNRLAPYMRDGAITSISLVTYSQDIAMAQRIGADWEFFERMGDRQFLQALLDSVSDEGGITLTEAVSFPGAADYVNQYLYLIYPAMDHISRRSYGVFVMEVNSDIFNQVIHANRNPTFLDSYISPYSCITDENGYIVVSYAYRHVGKNLYDLNIFDRMIVNSAAIPGSNLTVHLMFERSSMEVFTENFRNVVLIFVLVTMFIFSVCILFSIDRLMARSFKIAQAIQQFSKTHQGSSVEIDRHDEILFAIAEQFNHMSAETENLVNELIAKNEYLRIAKDQQLRAELSALEAQINPHFIYNVLDRINWIAIDNGQDQISRMLNGLASLLRYSINNIDMLVPLVAEIEWMRKYIYIQSERFGRDIIFNYDSEGDVWDYSIHKMLLQPLVENSILHGFEEHEGQAKIELLIRLCEDDWLEVSLKDNGCGIAQQDLEKIHTVIKAREQTESSHIGISNVSARLWYYYGENASMEFQSRLGQGTEVKLMIPGRYEQGV